MAVSWPLALQQYMNQADFSQKPQDTAIRTSPSTGPRKRRRRFTKPIVTQKCSIRIKGIDYDVFEDFFNITLAGGTLPFDFDDPISGDLAEWHCDGYSTSPLGGEWFKVVMDWEKST